MSRPPIADGPPVVFRGGPVFTMNESREVLPAGSGVLSENGVIRGFLPPGSHDPEGSRTVSFGERPILPAFLDPHVHFGMTNDSLARAVDCHTPPRESIEDVLDALRDGLHLAEARQGWVLGQGSLMHDKKLRERRLPNRHDLDRVSTDVPIVVRCGGHVTVLNSKALELSGLTEIRPLSGSAELIEDSDGRPNGVLVEGFALVPIPSLDRDERRRGLEETLASTFTRNGVTYIGEISNSSESLEDIALLIDEAPLTVDAFTVMPDTVQSIEGAIALRSRFADGPLRIRGIKIFVDGGFSAMTAATSSPYLVGSGHQGELYYDEDAVVELIRSCDEAGLQLVAHVNGSRAQALVCAANLRAMGADARRANTRLEHAGNFVPDLAVVEGWAQAGVSVVTQPGFLYTMGDYFPGLFGEHGSQGRFPYRTLRSLGVNLAASSDVSGSELRHANPFFSAWCSVERIGFGGEVIDPAESIGVLEALEMQTINAALAAGVEEQRGSLVPGKVTDLAVLDRDPRDVGGSELANIRVEALVREGDSIFDGSRIR